MKYKLKYHQYAYDTQIYGHCNSDGTEKLQTRMSKCVDEIAAWMEAKCPRLNNKPTEVSWFSSHRNRRKISSYSACVLENNIIPAKPLRNF